ncbi:cAMP-dependent protein kinase catalytic subunit [Coemansia brasiliensis]|uniref:cAMP-dependent protein kinase n=1 Tax=Coemansia brasiliensis TaxID=2650707 RepID=A0A9W8LZN7_9FUNG|nr:cAMP-dependent protein kinase catalytic subunit [Coemansia brasiliensis]
MFGRLNAKLAHLKASSQRAQTSETSAGPSTSSESPASVSPSAFASPTSVATSRAASPSTFQAARAASAAAKALPAFAANSKPAASTPDSPAHRSYHLYVETPLENAFPPLASPTAPSAKPSPPAKRRHSSPRLAQREPQPDTAAHPAKLTRLEGASVPHYPSSIPLPAAERSQQQLPVTLPAGNIVYPLPSMLQHPGQSQPMQQHVSQPDGSAMLAIPDPAAAAASPLCAGSSEHGPQEGRALDDFQLLHTLGTGTFGRVFLCQSRLTQRFYAMKVLRKSQVVKLKQVEHINNEKSILEVSRHPFIVQLECTMQNERNLYMLMEYVPGGELFSHLRRAGRFPDDVARFYAAEIVLALDYLHSMKIIWRDTKPENILLDAAGHVKLTDFGFAKRVEERTWTLCGTPEYLAPEIIQSKGHGKAVDWWALGILIFEMLAGYPPFYDDNPFGIYEKILEGKLVFPAFFSTAAKDLIQRLLTADVSKRLGNLQGEGSDVKAHPWFAMIDWDVLVRRRVPAPIVPPHRHPGDTCNFDKYPEPPQEPAPEPGVDPYFHLFSTF